MTDTLIGARNSRGFALPTVLIASVIMLTILLAAVGASSSIRTSLNLQYYNQLAREASESGVARARECLEKNGYNATWNDIDQLHPNTDCNGGSACVDTSNCFVMNRGNIRTTFSVDEPVDQTVSQIVNVTSKVELLRSSNGNVWHTYTNQLSARVGSDISFKTVSFGYYSYGPYVGDGVFFATIAADGTVRGVGNNQFGQLGNGTNIATLTPTLVHLPAGFVPVSMYTGFLSQGSNIYMIGMTGDVYGFGQGTKGQLGNGDFTDRNEPTQFNLYGDKATSITVNGKSTFVLTQTNKIYAAGNCWFGGLGSSYLVTDVPPDTGTGCSHVAAPQLVDLPAVSADPNTHPTSDIVADAFSGFVRMQGGRVYGWGLNHRGQLGKDPATVPYTSTPVQIGTYGDDPTQPKATQLAFDGETLYILDDTGKVYSYGANNFGQRGNGNTTDSFTGSQFELPVGAGIATKVTTDQAFVSVLSSSGQVWSAGLNDAGQLGDGATSPIQADPTQFILPVSPAVVKATDIYTASLGNGSPYNNTFVVADNGVIYGAGRNDFGQLGNGLTNNTSTPVAMHLPLGVQGLSVKTGYGTTIILTSNKKLYTVGNNNNGQLGDGTTINSLEPTLNPYVNILTPNYY
jgi:alpha-tubulin suppressor-like RCC1 family protein/Tfp pilus assembly protein PilV